MSALRYPKSGITRATNKLNEYRADIAKLNKPHDCPAERDDAIIYVRDTKSQLKEAQINLNSLRDALEQRIIEAQEVPPKAATPQSVSDLWDELNKHLDDLNLIELQDEARLWSAQLEFRMSELQEQEKLIPSEVWADTEESHDGDTHPTRRAKLRLPAMVIPTFDGDYKTYGSFWSSFEHMVHTNKDLNTVDKFIFLKQALKGNAARAIAPIPMNTENYTRAIDILKSRFDKGFNMTQHLMGEIRRIKPADQGHKSCSEAMEALQNQLALLEVEGVDLDKSAEVWRGILLSKFPVNIREKIITKEIEAGEEYNIPDLLAQITKLISISESVELANNALTAYNQPSYQARNDNRGKQQDRHFKSDHRKSDSRDQRPERKWPPCICGELHSPFTCSKFPTVAERRTELSRTKGCWKCFQSGHQTKDCSKGAGRKCPVCDKEHHKAVCLQNEKEFLARKNPSNGATQLTAGTPFKSQYDNKKGKPQNAHSAVDDPDVISAAQCDNYLNTVTEPQIVLMTVQALIFNVKECDYEPAVLFIDTGAQRSFIREEMKSKLQLVAANADGTPIPSTQLSVVGIGEIKTSFSSDEVKISLKSLHGDGKKALNLPIRSKPKLTPHLATADLSQMDRKFLKDKKLKLAQRTLAKCSVKPDILIGQDLISRIVIRGEPDITLPSGLIATPTIFGYAISGCTEGVEQSLTSSDSDIAEFSLMSVEAPVINEALDAYKQDIKNLYEIESLGIAPGKVENDQDILKFMSDYRATIEIKDKVATAGFPFTDEANMLKDNYDVAFRRLENLFKVLQNDPEKRDIYDQTIRDYEKNGIIEEVSYDSVDGDIQFYLPHRHVWTPGKSTQLRIVFDASSHAKNELSLNQVVFEGYSLTALIYQILLKFRTYEYAMIADIAKAFLQVRLPLADRDVTRFLWMHDPTKPPGGANTKVLRFARVPFGINASPAILNQVILKHLEEQGGETAAEIARTLYVDNVLLSGTTEEELTTKQRESKKLFEDVGMNLRDYLSNSETVNNAIPSEDRAKKLITSVLGMIWNSQADTFTLSSNKKEAKKISKRTVLSQINGLCYDPLGLLTPLLTRPKLLLQDIHRTVDKWDQVIDDNLQQQWQQCVTDMVDFEFTVPRKVTEFMNVKGRSLSVFVDTSQHTYACAAYVTTERMDGTKFTRLYSSKAKVAPLKKKLTIPKLELLSMQIGLTMAETIINDSGIKFESVYLFSDSMIALAWTLSEKRLPSIVMNLVQKIQLAKGRLEQHHSVHVFHVPTDENIADVATRGLTQKELIGHVWWTGPSWLNAPKERWPVKMFPSEEAMAPFNLHNFLTMAMNAMDVKIADDHPRKIKFSKDHKNLDYRNCPKKGIYQDRIWPVENFKIPNLSRVKRVVAYCFRFIEALKRCVRHTRHMNTRSWTEITYDNEMGEEVTEYNELQYDDNPYVHPVPDSMEMERAENALILQEQQQVDLNALMTGCKDQQFAYETRSSWFYGGPVMPLLTKISRLGASELDKCSINSVYLPKQSPLTLKIVREMHIELAHCGTSHLVSELRRRFWVPRDRQLCQQVTRHCAVCRRQNGLPYRYPRMPDLPSKRVRQAAPFAHSGVDFMGPIMLKGKSGEVKVWVALFTCLVTRLVHLEVATDLSASHFILVMKRFMARRGVVRSICSDNGSNFRLASTVLTDDKEVHLKDEDTVATYLASHNIQWTFISPGSPWMGGSWERMVAQVKTALKKTIGKQKIDFETFRTILCEVEAIVNCRPLTYVGEGDMAVLRPVDFIYRDIRYGTEYPGCHIDPEDPDYSPDFVLKSRKDVIRAIDYSEKMTTKFWNKWSNEYLLGLRDQHTRQSMNCRSTPREPLVGEVIIVDDDKQLPRGEWRLATIVELIKGKDGKCRSAMIRFASGRQVQRPIIKLIPLEIESNDMTNVDIGEIDEPEAPPPSTQSRAELPSQPVAKSALREQPKRKAKNNISYTENFSIMYRSKSMPLLFLAMCLLSLLSPTEGSVLFCNKGGVTINSGPESGNQSTMAEICVNYANCIRIMTQTEPMNYQVPLEASIHDYSVQWRMIVDGKQYTETAMCAGTVICELITCFFCAQLLGNPQCLPKTAIAALALLCYISLTILIVTWNTCARSKFSQLARKVGNSCLGASRRMKKAKKRLPSESEEDAIPLIPRSGSGNDYRGNDYRSKLVTIIAIMAIWMPTIHASHACQQTHILDTRLAQCAEKTTNISNCQTIHETTFSLSSRRSEVCLRTRDGSTIMSQISFQFQHIRLTCDSVVQYYTRDIEMKTESAKRCPHAGSCSSDLCTLVSAKTVIPELNQTYAYPGVTRCQESCGGIACGCLLPTSGCLFSRSYAKPIDDTIYKVVTCPTWKPNLVMHYEEVMRNGSHQTYHLTMRSEVAKTVQDSNITVDWITTPNLPILSRTFLVAEGNDTSVAVLIPENTRVALRCPSAIAAAGLRGCHVQNTCTCDSTETMAHCECDALKISDLKNDLDSRFPITTEQLNMVVSKGTLRAYSQNSIAQVSIRTPAQNVDSIVHKDPCTLEISEAKGCFNCLKGAQVTVRCNSPRPSSVHVDCGSVEFVAPCSPNGTRTIVNVHTQYAKLDETCEAKCGDTVHGLKLSGILAYHSLWNEVQSTNEHATYVSFMNVPDLTHMISVLSGWWKTTLLAIIAIAAAVAGTILFGPAVLEYLVCKALLKGHNKQH